MNKLVKILGRLYEWRDDHSGNFSQQGLDDGRDLLRFLRHECDFWSDIFGPLHDITMEFRNVVMTLGVLQKLRRKAEENIELGFGDISLNDEDPFAQKVNNLYKEVDAFFKESQLPISNSPFSDFLQNLANRGQVTAIYCLTAWIGDTNSFNTLPDGPMGDAYSALAQEGFLKEAHEINVEEDSEELLANVSHLAQMQNGVQAEVVALKEEWKNHKYDEAESLAGARKRMDERGNGLVAEFSSKLELIGEKWDELKKEVENTATALENKIALNMSENYWETKTAGHWRMSIIFGLFTCVYFCILGYGAWYLFGQLPSLLGGEASLLQSEPMWREDVPVFLGYHLDVTNSQLNSESNLHLYAVQAALGLASSTLIFWVGRLLTRLFLSEHHLRIDAAERVVMMKTYLAFTAKGDMTEKQISLLLAPLFRPTADGIVKDDAAPDWSVAAILSKTGMSN